VLLVGAVLLTVLSAGGMFAYKYLTKTNDDLQVVMSGPAPEPAAAVAGADVDVDSSLLIEQEDYDSLLAEELDNTTPAAASDAATAQPLEQDGDYSLSTTAAETNEATTGNAQKPRRSAFDKGGLSIRRSQDKEPLQNILMRGYTAYNKGEFENAEIAYRQALTRAPNSRDAMLGMAAVHYIRGDTAAAAAYYRKLLQRDPKDELALAALAGIEDTAESSLTQASLSEESRIKLLLAEKPDSGYLHFTLGNIYADERRWAEAEQAYFDAHRLEPENPDYAFNLAVSLDHLGKKKSAAGYYRQSLTLARDRKANFDTRIAVDRLDSLQEF
jgi:Flp pilus assembly protein TadD